jgi:hypothetical protein
MKDALMATATVSGVLCGSALIMLYYHTCDNVFATFCSVIGSVVFVGSVGSLILSDTTDADHIDID